MTSLNPISEMRANRRECPRAITIWVVVCAFFTCAGWILSALHQLNLAGYSAAVLAGGIASVVWWKKNRTAIAFGTETGKFRRRFRKGFPIAFLAVAILAFLGGAIHAPSNYDALAYRVPRVLHWLADGRWHWIHTSFQRLNVRATGIEWVSAPLIVFFKTDRLLFLINIASFLLLPGLVFGAFTRLGVNRRAAWHWMWLVPTGYCFLLQAGSIGNDLFGAVFALAALDFALRAKTSRRISDVWLAVLASALLTGGKTSNFPLLLPILIALLPSLPLLPKRLAASAVIVLLAALASFLPVALLNIQNCGDWSGQAAEQAEFMSGSPILHITQNTLLLAEQNLAPPIFPMAGAWNRAILKIIPKGRQAKLDANFEPGGAHLALGELALEEDAGLGCGVSLLLLATFAATFFSRRQGFENRPRLSRFQIVIFGSALIALLPYFWVSGSTTAARLLTPYYCLIVPFFLLGQTGDWIKRHNWWRGAAMLVFLVAILLLVISPARPLWPANLVFSKFAGSQSALVKRAATVYSVYSQRADSFAPVREQLPPDATLLGLITFDDPETSLWRPFGRRRIEHVLPGDTVAYLNSRGIKYVLISTAYFSEHNGPPLKQWLELHDAKVIKTIPLTLRASKGPVDWVLVEIGGAGTKGL
jgi:hypothetical protein